MTQHTHCRYISTYTCMHVHLRFRLPRIIRRRRVVVTRHTSLVDHFMFIVAARELSAGGFVGKPNVSECARAYVWLRVSRVHVRRTKTSGGGRGERDESHVCGGSTTIYSRDPRSVCHPCPHPRPRPPATVPFPPRCSSSSFSSSCSSLILLLFLLYYDGLLHFHSDAGLKIKSLIHDA